jgi:MFS family permease
MVRNPFVESMRYPGNPKRLFVALFGITGVLTTIWYTAFFSGMSFLRGPMRVDEATVEIVMLFAGGISMAFYLLVGKWSDRVGRKRPIIIGALASLVLLFPIFWGIGALANPGLAASAERAPVVVSGAGCEYDAFASKQATECGRLLADLTSLGVSYTVGDAQGGARLTAGSAPIALDVTDDAGRKAALQTALEGAGYDFSKQAPPFASLVGIVALLCCLGMLSALTYGSVAALLAEMFPPQIRYSSMSIPYHIGAGYLGGFLPLIAGYIVATTGNPYSGLWYTWAVVAFGVIVAWWGVPGGPPRDFVSSDNDLPVSPANP